MIVYYKRGRHEYLLGLNRHLELCNLYVDLENDEMEYEYLYHTIEKDNTDSYKLEGKLEELLETNFVTIYTDITEVIE